MAMKLYSDSDIQDIADAIRSVNGSSDTYKVSEMAAEIRKFSYTPPVQITNLVPISIDNSGNVFNSTGYKNGNYMSGGNVGSADANATITGYIEMNAADASGIGDVYRIKGVGEPSASHTRIALVNTSFGSIGETNSFLSGSAGGIMGNFNFSTETVNGETVYVLTVNRNISASYSNPKYLRFSFDGTDGADLVITCNEVIQ